MDPRKERIAANEAAFRALNESLNEHVHDRLGGTSARSGFVCECAQVQCSEVITVDLARYERIRSDPLTFFVVPGHELPETEDVVERTRAYYVVRKHEEARPVAE